MSLSHYRDSIVAELEKAGDSAANKAINTRVHPQMTADAYAMAQVDTLSEARAFATARNIVIAEYKKMTETSAQQDETQEMGDQQSETKAKPLYG